MICEGLEFLGIKLDENRNKDAIAIEQIISTPDSRVSVIVVPTNEEQIIVRDTLTIAGQQNKGQLRTA